MSGSAGAHLTPESKSALRKAILGLRSLLIAQLRDHAEQRYLLKVPYEKAKGSLTQELRERRRRLEAALELRAAEDGGGKDARERAFVSALKETGATFLNRLVLLRHLEATGLSKPAVVTGGWKSPGYQQFRELAPALMDDETQGYGVVLQLLFDELAADLPGLFGNVGLTSLLPLAPSTLRAVIEALEEVPAEAWKDDLTLGWVYQFWNDPEREALDEKLHARGKLESHELASKTQMFTERYMVEWLLQNSLGSTWLAMCRKNGWTAEVEQSGTLASLDARRVEWRGMREDGYVAPDALMPVDGALEEAWKYHVPQPLPQAVVDGAPASIRELKLLDPACGSGHFLVVAFDLLVELYREEARHRGEVIGDREIAESILENNLHGVDIDPRAVQIAAAALFLKARALSREAQPKRVNLVAPALRISALAADDPALRRLEADIEASTGIPVELTRELVQVLAGVDHLGTLLKVGDAVDRAIRMHRGVLAKRHPQPDLFLKDVGAELELLSPKDAKRAILDLLEAFFARHEGEEDLGLRLHGQQLKAGLRFATIVREGAYHLVVANPPYQGTAKMKDASYIAKHYPRGKSDLFAAFLERGLELCRPGGASAMVTMRNWMFLTGYTRLREHLLQTYDLRVLGDVDRGAFEEVPNEVLATVMSVFRKAAPASEPSVALQPTPLSDKSYDRNRTARKRAAVLTQVGRFEFHTADLPAVPKTPVIYWWTSQMREEYRLAPKLEDVAPARQGLATADNTRFVRKWWEVDPAQLALSRDFVPNLRGKSWAPFINGGKGRAWFEPLTDVIQWQRGGLEVRAFERSVIRNPDWYFVPGIAFTSVGFDFAARLHRYRSVFGNKGQSVFAEDVSEVLLVLQSRLAGEILSALNLPMFFEAGDMNRLPADGKVPAQAPELLDLLEREFDRAEQGRETSVEFRSPATNQWDLVDQWAREWMQSDGEGPLTSPAQKPPPEAPPESRLSFAVGVALGRFGAQGEGLLAEVSTGALSSGILFLSASQDSRDGLSAPATQLLRQTWTEKERPGDWSSALFDLREWLRRDYFDHHRDNYENRPIYFPLSSTKKSFVAYVSIHRWNDATLTTLLAEHLLPERRALEGALVDLQAARQSTDPQTRASAGQAFTQHRKWLDELEEFIAKVQELSERGPPSPDAKTPPREADAPFRMDLDDGVMVNSAALWPLLEPMWKDPKKWWKELATAKGRKDYDWSHLAVRYFSTRVDEKCRKAPSLAVAHGCFWKYHPEKALQWELRLQNEIGPDFTIDEVDSDTLRAKLLHDSPRRAEELRIAELARRERKSRKQDQEELDLDPDCAAVEDDTDEEATGT